jgi:hypothetical protein
VNIEEFYEANEARRNSEEIEFGDDWRDTSGRVYELSWIAATGELFLMADPDAQIATDTFGDGEVLSEPLAALAVKVIAVVPTRDDLERHLDGWTEATGQPGSLAWLAARFPGVTSPT